MTTTCSPTATLLHARDVVKSYADCRVLSGVSVSVAPGHRPGLVGESGAGKSTLLRLLAGTEDPDSGQVTRPADVGFLHQETHYDAAVRVEIVIEDALARLWELEREVAAAATALSRRRVERAAGASVGLLEQDVTFPQPQRSPGALYESAATGNAVPDLVDLRLVAPRDLDRPVGLLSVGQQRRRLALALLVALGPHVLLLDEPTNHLSLTLADELEDALGTAPDAVVVAAHDRGTEREIHLSH